MTRTKDNRTDPALSPATLSLIDGVVKAELANLEAPAAATEHAGVDLDAAMALEQPPAADFETELANQFEAAHRLAEQEPPAPATASEAMIYAKHDIDIFWRRAHAAGANPYLLESATTLGDLSHAADRARATINALAAEIDHITGDAATQIQRISARRDAETAQRQERIDDLMKIVAADTLVNGENKESPDDL